MTHIALTQFKGEVGGILAGVARQNTPSSANCVTSFINDTLKNGSARTAFVRYHFSGF